MPMDTINGIIRSLIEWYGHHEALEFAIRAVADTRATGSPQLAREWERVVEVLRGLDQLVPMPLSRGAAAADASITEAVDPDHA